MDEVFELNLTKLEIEVVIAALDHLKDDAEHSRRVVTRGDVDEARNKALATALNKTSLLQTYVEAEYNRRSAYQQYKSAVYGEDSLPF